MALTTYSISGPASDLTGIPHTGGRDGGGSLQLIIEQSEKMLGDGSGGIRVGKRFQPAISTSGMVTFPDLPATEAGYPLYRLVGMVREPGRKPTPIETGWFELTANRTLEWVVENTVVPEIITAEVATDIRTAHTETMQARDEVQAISGLTGEDEAVAYLMANPSDTSSFLNESYVAQGQTLLDLGRQAGVDTTGATDSTAALQSALNAAATFGVRAFARGSIKTSSMISIDGDVDLSGLTILYSGNGTAVRLGAQSTPSFNRVASLGPIINTKKTTLGWSQVAGSVGVEIRNAYTWDIRIKRVHNFEVGILGYGSNSLGTSYCNIYPGHLDNNKINLKLDAENATNGYCNQNTFYGGRYGHTSNESPHKVGTKNIFLAATTGQVSPNNNTWVNASIESPNVAEYLIDVQGGAYNQFLNPRMEYMVGIAKVRWGAFATRNQIIGGNAVEIMQEEWVAGAALNSVQSAAFTRIHVSGESGGGVVLENNAGNSTPALSIMRAGGVALGDAPSTAYGTRLEYARARWKRYNDAADRVRLDGSAGRLLFGSGAADPVAGFLGGAGSLLVTSGTSVVGFETDNATDIGGTSGSRPRYIRAATAVQTAAVSTANRPAASTARAGASVFDTTLAKPIWSDGTNWRDATGAIV